ncbi:MAG TPA: Gfo/Idh/MocA family oxidoreductase [Roseimicrobium sp.]|nr:Gfo/Idh/MocA family oxidoreductase [Roseimicrobium sp.]
MPGLLKTVLVGCGAVSGLYYVPAITEARKHAGLEVVGVFDPARERVDALLPAFPGARGMMHLDELIRLKPDLAIIASPPRFHADQTVALLRAGSHVLCEKPMADTVADAERMMAAANEAGRVLAVGLFRRFFPALQTIRSLVTGGTLGAPVSFHFAEGGAFSWPATSAAHFQKTHARGGVLLDLGVHVLDLVHWWFGEPDSMSYEDDSMGNLEANAMVSFRYKEALSGTVRLSRDTPMSNRFTITFERGTVIWKVGEAERLEVTFNGAPFALAGQLKTGGRTASTYPQSFVNQLIDVAAAARNGTKPQVPGEEGIHSIRMIERCYRSRRLMQMPWLSTAETGSATALNSSRE